MTFAEFCLRALAYERQEINKWQHTRWIGLKIIEPHLKKDSRVTVQDLLPLPSDPTAEELQKARESAAKDFVAKGVDKIKRYTELGLITALPPKENAPTTDTNTDS